MHVCPDCGISFSSKLRFESHLRANSIETFFETFTKIAISEKEQGRFENADQMLSERIVPMQHQLKESRRFKGGYKNEKLKEPRVPDHKNVKKDTNA